jgi:anaerobic ribonucleoside-triphosphate reductase
MKDEKSKNEGINCTTEACIIPEVSGHRVAVKFPETIEELLSPRQGRPIQAVIKRGSNNPSEFDTDMIASAITKASKASGKNYTPEVAEEITKEIEARLRTQKIFPNSKRAIPHVEDIQDTVLQIFDERNAREISTAIASEITLPYDQVYSRVLNLIQDGKLDPTGDFYRRHREQRSEVREKIVNLPFSIEFDSTDKQLQIHSIHNGKSHKFDADGMIDLILERTAVKYDDAKKAVKRVEEYLANRKGSSNIGKEEIISIMDASLMEMGYPQSAVFGGRRLDITLDDVDQLIISKSVENSNIKKNNPEAVNLGIAELALKQKALRDVFDEDVAEAHRSGAIHLHDLGYVDRVYCSAHSVEYIKKYGLDKVVANLDAKSTPAKAPQVLNNHIHTFLAAIQSSYAGALGFPMLNTLYGPALLKEVEMIEGYEIRRNEKGEIIDKVQKRIRKQTLENRIQDGDLTKENFEQTGSRKILTVYDRNELKQLAQNLVFGASQSAFSRGGQTLFIDFNIDLDTPAHVKEVPALFLGAEYKKIKQNEFGEWQVTEKTSQEPPRYDGIMTNKGHKDAKGKPILEPDNKNGDVIQPEDGTVWATYGHDLVRKAARDFAEALFEVSAEGDKYGNMFNFPKIDVHVGRETFEDKECERLLKKACETTEKNDSIYFMYDRGDGMNVAQCCRLRERVTDPKILKDPSKMRFCGFQNVSINLPQASYRAKGDNMEEKLQSTFDEIDKTMLIALKAHTNKRRYIQTLFDTEGSPLHTMGGVPSDDGSPYIDLAKSTYIFGIVGLNEAVQHITGKQMDNDPEAYKVGLKILSHMYSVKSEFTKRYGMKFVIEETPGESTNRRLAKIDQVKYPEQTKAVIKGNIENDQVYYTNSSHIRADAEVGGLDRMILQSKMNPMIEAGAITHIFSGEKQNKAEAVLDFVKAGYFNTQSSQVVFSGEHTVCLSCGSHVRGLREDCPKCGNKDPNRISQKTRVVGYFSDPRSWNKSKQGELVARQNTQEYYAGEKSSLRDLEAELLQSSIEQGKLRVSVIGSKGCAVCDEALNRVKRVIANETYVPLTIKDNLELVKYDVGTEEGRVISAIYDVPIDTYPTIVIHQGDKILKKGWEYPYNKPAKGLNTGEIGKMFQDFLGYSQIK